MRSTVMRFRIPFLFIALAVLSCKVPAIGPIFTTPTATVTNTPTATPTPTPTLTPTPTPTPQPSLRLDSGDEARFWGDWDKALSEYQAVLQLTEDPDERAKAELGICLTLVQARRYSEAIQALTAYIDKYPEHALLAHGFFLRALSFLRLGDDEQAILDFDVYLQKRPGILDSYVQEWNGDALRRLGRPMEAIPRYESALAAAGIGGTITLRAKIGYAFFEAGDYQHASENFFETYQLTTSPGTKAAMNLMAGRSLEAIGDLETAYTRYLDSVVNLPQYYESYLGLVTLVNAGVVVDEFQRGLVDYYAEAYEPALAAFNRYLTTTPTGTAFFYRGLTKRALGDPWGAIEDFQWVIDTYPQDWNWAEAWFEKAWTEWISLSDPGAAVQTYLSLVEAAPLESSAADALFRAAQLSERMGDLGLAASIWIRIPQEYPNDAQAFEGAFLAGVTRFRLGEYLAARDAFLLADAITTQVGDKAAARLWAGKTYLEEGDQTLAEEWWTLAAASDPTGYYSERAADLLAGNSPFQAVVDFARSSDLAQERMEAENWMRETFAIQGPDPLNELDSTLSNDIRLLRGDELWNLGLYEEARAEFEDLRIAYQADPEATYRLMHKFLDLGLYRSAIFAARQVLQLAGMGDAATMDAPVYFNHIRFGFYFGDLIFSEATQYGFDSLFVFSVLRQESAFEGFVTSYADARGLMQIIPSTGQDIAQKLGWPADYSQDDLYRPLVSVQFGLDYLADQRDLFEGDLFAALSAYNAGPGNALIWKELAPDDPDLYLEIIRIDQPQQYIRGIYEIYDIYRNLYAVP
jgi:soluble lytic murein transglycosylase